MKKNNRVVGKVVNGRIIMVSENGGYIKPVSRVVEEPKKKAPTKRNRISARPVPVSDDVPEFVRTAVRSRAKHEEEKQEDNNSKIVKVDFPQHVESLPEMIIDWAIGLGKHAVRPLTRYFEGDKVKDIFKEETR
jgi:hypothetical protein